MCVFQRLALMLSLALAVATPVHAQPLSVAQAQKIALADNPKLARIQARYTAALEVPAQAAALPDPTVTLGLLNVPTDTFNLDQEGMTQFKVGIVQPLPWASERKLAESSAQHLAASTVAELDEARNMLVRDVSRSWWTLYFIERSLAVVEENLQRLREFNRIAQSRYRVGKGLQQDTLQAQLQLSTQLERRLVLQGQRRNVAARLNALLAQPSEQSLAIDLAEPLLPLQLPLLERLIETALQKRPSIRQQQDRVDAAKDRQALARKGLLPDLTLGAAYGYRQDAPNGASRADLVSINLGIKIPLYAKSKQHRAISQRGAEVIARKEALYSTQLSVRSEVVEAASDYQRAQEQVELLEQGIIPQSRQTVASMLVGYQVGKVDFSALIQAQLTVNRVQLQYWKAIRDGELALASLRAAIGGDQNDVMQISVNINEPLLNRGKTHE